ncbi:MULTISPECIES: amidase [Achromobacter]|uniref:amidase n=1 Tax=Achromobacter sp. TaxID=134375 RepID=UPI002F91E3A5
MQFSGRESTDICSLSAVEMAAEIRQGHLSATDAVLAHLRRIEAVNPKINAIIALDADAALAAARAADLKQARGEALGPMHGLPVAHKDNQAVAGMPTTHGSPLFANNIATVDSIVVERQRKAGAITLGKTNLPEFAAGSHTFNSLFGLTRNPYDLTRSAGGSSGGAAAALAAEMVALADGTDMGGSLRNPASFCNVVGLRPSFGLIPVWPQSGAWSPLSVPGPMARTVQDAALFLGVLAGPDPRDPTSANGEAFKAGSLEGGVRGLRVAYAPTLGGLPVEEGVQTVVDAAVATLASLGCEVELNCPDLARADRMFHVLRALSFETAYGDLVRKHPNDIKAAVRWNASQGAALSATDIGHALRTQVSLYQEMRAFLEDYDFLVAPVSQVAPFPGEQEYPTWIEGEAVATYIDWMKSCSRITATGHPAISLPCGFTAEGLPVGIQIVGRFHGERDLLRLAYALESSLGARKRPSINQAGPGLDN